MKFSSDAQSAATMFHANNKMTLTFQTPARIHPRMLKALKDLCTARVLRRAVERKGGGYEAWHFTVFNEENLAAVPKQSFRQATRNSLPITHEIADSDIRNHPKW